MANTKDTLIIVQASAAMDESVNAAGRILGADATYGLDNATPTDAATFAAAEGYTLDAFTAATAGVTEVDTTGVAAGEELFVTIIDVTNGRRQFPREDFPWCYGCCSRYGHQRFRARDGRRSRLHGYRGCWCYHHHGSCQRHR